MARKKDRKKERKTRPDTRHKMRLVCVLFTFENNAGPTDLRMDRQTDGRTDGRTDMTSYRDATAHLKTGRRGKNGKKITGKCQKNAGKRLKCRENDVIAEKLTKECTRVKRAIS